MTSARRRRALAGLAALVVAAAAPAGCGGGVCDMRSSVDGTAVLLRYHDD